ncbi:MAG: hypothetical protein JWP97_1263 [Labilithrix sp.]|nr:hypothetical protein [Labilithrix sp.]
MRMHSFPRAWLVAAVVTTVGVASGDARAESSPAKTEATVGGGAGPTAPATAPGQGVTDQARARIIDRPHTIAEVEAGIIALPNAPISAGQSGGATPFGTIGRGDATLEVGVHVLYRPNRSFAIGANVQFAPLPTADTEYGGLVNLSRTHSRSYFTFGGEARYIPIHYKFLEAWGGVTLGGVVVADRFATNAGDDVAPIIGSKEVTVRTEGFAMGVQVGGTYYLSENWIAGASFRASRWVLPEAQRCSSIGDCATLSGAVVALELGLTIGYRLPL